MKEQTLLSVLLGVSPDVAESVNNLWKAGWKIQFDGAFNVVSIVRGKKNEKI